MRPAVAGHLRKVQVRIAAVTTLGLAVILVGAGHLLIDLFERQQLRELDGQLLTISDNVARIGASDVQLPLLGSPEDLAQLVDDGGDVVYSSVTLGGEPAMWTPGDGERRPRTVGTAAAGDVRISAVPFREHWAVLGVPLRPVQAATGSLRTAMLLWFPFLAASLAVGVWFIVGRTLRPVAAAREREEQLVADVSHELRNPLAGLRVLLETEAHAPGEVALSRIEALSTLGRLEAVADQLLVVTRQEHRTGRTAGQPVDLDDVVLGQVRGLALRSPVRVDTSAVRSGQVVGREHDLAGLVENLVTNAVRHARSVVRVGVHERAGTVELAVDDDGPGVDPADRERIFERFTRLDEARSRDQGGAGLGLAIVRAIVDAHDGSIEVEDSALGGARFVVRLPAGTPGGG